MAGARPRAYVARILMSSRSLSDPEDVEAGTSPAAPETATAPARDPGHGSRIEEMAREALMSSPPPSVSRSGSDAERPRSSALPVRPVWSPLEATLTVLDDRWKTLVVWNLFWGAKPFSELIRCTHGLTKKNLRHALSEMERHGLVRKDLRYGQRRRAEYALTPYGETLKPIVGAMYEWGLQHGLSPATGGVPS
jgi:DNA-binding HxlR family transcriptional regulator